MILLLPRDLMLWCLVLAAALQMCPTCAEMSPGREDGGYYTTRTHEIYLFTIYTDIYYLSPLRTPCLCHVISTQGAAVWRGRAAALHTARPAGCRCITCTHLTSLQPSQPSPAQPSPAQQIFSCWCIKREEESFNVLLGIMEISDTSLSKYIKRLLSL